MEIRDVQLVSNSRRVVRQRLLVLGVALVLCSIAAAALSWEMAARLLTCRA